MKNFQVYFSILVQYYFCKFFLFSCSNSVRNCCALGIVADSPEAGELARLPRTMSGKPDGELASRNAQVNSIIITFLIYLYFIRNCCRIIR